MDAVYLTELKGDILPPNTGLLLQYPQDVPQSINYQADQDEVILGNTVNSNYVYMEPENTETSEATLIQPSGTNYLVPYIANNNAITTHSKDTEWEEHANVKRPESEYLNYILAYKAHKNTTTKVLDFFEVGKCEDTYELRKSFVSIPKNDPNIESSGDITFNAKPFGATSNIDKSACVVTDHIDIIFGVNQQVPTGLRVVHVEDNSKEDAPYYNLQGIRVEHPAHGVFIHNGKKIIIK